MKKNHSKKVTALLILIVMLFGILGCGGNGDTEKVGDKDPNAAVNEKLEAGENVEIDGEKPVLRILNGYNTNLDLNADVMAEKVEEITGYEVEWYNLPSENPTQAMLLDISSGSSYDLLFRVPAAAVTTLYDQGALMDLRENLTLYGNNIIKNSKDEAWIATTGEDGQIYAIPYTNYQGSAENPYGSLCAGMAFNKAALDELGMEMPTNLDELEAVCEEYMKKTGQPAITFISSAYITPIAYAFGVNESWSEQEGEYVPRIRRPEFLEYITYIQNMYHKGYIDSDLPINNQTSALEKFTTGKCLAYGYFMFWDSELSTPAFQAAGIDPEVVLQGAFAKDASSETIYAIRQTYTSVCAIPKTAENAEHAMAFLDALTQSDNFKELFIGEEGVTYEEKEDGELYPIFPAFNDYLNADRYVGIPNADDAFYWWRCRARKTDEYAKLYKELCEQSVEYTAINDYSGYAISVPEYLENNTYLTSIVSTRLMAGIASDEEPQVILDGIIKEWEANGGLELEEAMNEWWQENKDQLQ
ncbi:MAG: extracellular solute-binding protein [Lachnospiraceae bacterium]